MAQGDTPICIVGNVVTDVELRWTPSGAAVANFRIASNPRVFNKNTNQHEDGDPLFLTCNVWREQGEHLTESIQKGMRVIVSGNLKQRSFETREGEQRTVYEVDVEDVGPSLKWATAKVTRANRQQSGQGGGGYTGGGGGGQRPPTGQQGGQAAPQGSDDPWGSAPQGQQQGLGGGFDDDIPPF